VRHIEIDDDVYAELERHVRGFEQPNDVLRRLLLKEEAGKGGADVAAPRAGRLLPLIGAGLLAPDDALRHEQARKGGVFAATVTASGWLRTRKGLYQAPSPALTDLVGSQIDGWANWVHVPSGKSLRRLRDEL